MDAGIGKTKLFDLLERFKDDPDVPKHLSDLKEFEVRCRQNGYVAAADYVKSWRLFMEYHIKAEWLE